MEDMLLQRIFDKLDVMDIKISDLCNRITKQEEYHKVQQEFRHNTSNKNKWGWNRFFGIAATIGMVVVILLSVL
tara:strand:- start:458 stop:679 length:222 start_codon:yes stop_codon:yes gene_type:complete